MVEPLLQARGLQKRYGGLVATRDLDLDLYQGEIHAVIGPNGAGKTTALAQLSGEQVPDAGRIVFDGRDVTALSMPHRARLGIARSYQVTAVFLDFSVLENIAVAVQARARHHFHFFASAGHDDTLRKPAEALMREVGLEGLAHRPAADLAHGQRRQLELAMALATEPRVLLLDEPMAGMGAAEADAMGALLERLRSRYAVLLVEHDMDMVFRLADRVTVLVDGAVIASGDPAAIRADAAVQAAYLEEST
ncbi:branched-chain amino acid transport system ATP-binding protein [Natronocella acetinitrilica]|uniref:Branched-chain amino acid transport system ATP-binding protein n=1 Tax=Natronocella acetinitrilica TaxID=414046 RepID=A0AAE3G446_9GAMM|nr:ABC transporter ATP-binding protein [Natronocella acetinitrilica]MCP1675294.1 branched-chain amino acid transport system ATP-binding protein [Natronocella acetinitrilica]